MIPINFKLRQKVCAMQQWVFFGHDKAPHGMSSMQLWQGSSDTVQVSSDTIQDSEHGRQAFFWGRGGSVLFWRKMVHQNMYIYIYVYCSIQGFFDGRWWVCVLCSIHTGVCGGIYHLPAACGTDIRAWWTARAHQIDAVCFAEQREDDSSKGVFRVSLPSMYIFIYIYIYIYTHVYIHILHIYVHICICI